MKEKNLLQGRFVQSYLSSVLSITLVLALTGVGGLLYVNAQALEAYIKAHIGIDLVLSPVAKPQEVTAFRDSLSALPYVATATLVSKEEGRAQMEAVLGKDFLDVFSYNPLPASIELSLQPEYVRPQALQDLSTELEQSPLVQEAAYQESLLQQITRNIETIGLYLGGFILLLVFISFVLISNTIRLSLYAKRLTIHTMRMVGATKAFIRRPFMVQALLQGLIASLLAILCLIALLMVFQRDYPDFFTLTQPSRFLGVFALMGALGVGLCLVATAAVIRRIVRIEGEALYL